MTTLVVVMLARRTEARRGGAPRAQKHTNAPCFHPPPADPHPMPGAEFGLCPGTATSGRVRRIEPFGDDSFERHAARRAQHGIAGCLEMLYILNDWILFLLF